MKFLRTWVLMRMIRYSPPNRQDKTPFWNYFRLEPIKGPCGNVMWFIGGWWVYMCMYVIWGEGCGGQGQGRFKARPAISSKQRPRGRGARHSHRGCRAWLHAVCPPSLTCALPLRPLLCVQGCRRT
jgi:hypothetical protein